MVGERRITDLGTQFLVRRNDDGLEVAVVQGRVRFDAPTCNRHDADGAAHARRCGDGDSANDVGDEEIDARHLTRVGLAPRRSGVRSHHACRRGRPSSIATTAANSSSPIRPRRAYDRRYVSSQRHRAFARVAQDVFGLRVENERQRDRDLALNGIARGQIDGGGAAPRGEDDKVCII